MALFVQTILDRSYFICENIEKEEGEEEKKKERKKKMFINKKLRRILWMGWKLVESE